MGRRSALHGKIQLLEHCRHRPSTGAGTMAVDGLLKSGHVCTTQSQSRGTCWARSFALKIEQSITSTRHFPLSLLVPGIGTVGCGHVNVDFISQFFFHPPMFRLRFPHFPSPCRYPPRAISLASAHLPLTRGLPVRQSSCCFCCAGASPMFRRSQGPEGRDPQ